MDSGQLYPLGAKVSVRQTHRPWFIFAVVAILLSTVTLMTVRTIAVDATMQDLEQQSRIDAGLKVAFLKAVLERPRALPLILARDRDVTDTLTAPTQEHLDALNRKLQDLVEGTNASVIYVIDRRGVAIASSNWREPSSFVGVDYSFRQYFSRAMAEGKAEHFALGSISLRPGLYISQRVGPPDNPIGVVVAKAEFDQLERDWRDAQRPTYVTDAHGVVLITSIESWRFMVEAPLSPPVQAEIRSSLQFGDAPLLPLPITRERQLSGDAATIDALLPGASVAGFVEMSLPVPSTPWSLRYLLPVQPQLDNGVGQAQVLSMAILLPLLGLAALVIWRRQTSLRHIAAEQAARIELERRVLERTTDLSRARDRLEAEIADHRATENRLQGVQEELVQANRLAILGQVAAGVAHEINQPVATIRAYADNAITYLDRQREDAARDNLTEIAGLTERIGSITEDLKALARRGRSAAEPVDMREAIAGALVLLKSRFSGRLDRVEIWAEEQDLYAIGNRLRLEQVLINLIQNALEAVEPVADGTVVVSAGRDADRIHIRIEDNGGGIAPAIQEQLFSPFNSSKEKGLGLGLVIAKDIVTDYGGKLSVETSSQGTIFLIDLKQADR
ncbi:sensor histidine kinase [Rhizobium rhizoryzae]|jgi:two-component system C4-dicarboxylate transport sensor histidine kinase DctB|uniref:C4-dicarboxylate transport sensor protein n=1 Tax=Rhizobium rhizoryzae TaxID=451876 RepID=A0A7W6LGE5_9HYPH|nr:ATP-binding protein [Rhizobium rhizoryzae]MBB4143751.1 two-component system C4-dicarboxylate transport sensor histidine kinase DctB [Rhizobium rhizoryzae]